MTATPPAALRQVIGAAVARLRTGAGKRQQDVADAARAVGLNWDRSTVAAIERGAKPITIEGLIVLPYVLGAVIGRPVAVAELFTTDDPITLTPGVDASGSAIAETLAGGWEPESFRWPPGVLVFIDPEAATAAEIHSKVVHPSAEVRVDFVDDPRFQTEIERVLTRAQELGLLTPDFPGWPDVAGELVRWMRLVGDAEMLAARRLGEPAAIVVALALSLWGRTLRAERDTRVQARHLPADASPATGAATAGQVTRDLQDELRDEIKRRIGAVAQLAGFDVALRVAEERVTWAMGAFEEAEGVLRAGGGSEESRRMVARQLGDLEQARVKREGLITSIEMVKRDLGPRRVLGGGGRRSDER